jgi:hypothetical protein
MKPKIYRFDVGKNNSTDCRYRLFVTKADYDRLLKEHIALQELSKRPARRVSRSRPPWQNEPRAHGRWKD